MSTFRPGDIVSFRTVDPDERAFIHEVVAERNGRVWLVPIDSPIHDKSGWLYDPADWVLADPATGRPKERP